MKTYPRRSCRLFRYFCLFVVFSLCSPPLATPYFRDSGLMDIPTGEVIEHGSFDIGANINFRNEAVLTREEAAIRLDIGLFDRVEVGLTSVRLNQEGFLMANFKARLFRETGKMPNVSAGVQNVGDEVKQELIDPRRYKRKSAYLAISKTFNLPRLHRISGHIGIGNNRFNDDLGIGKLFNRVFLGISKDFQPSFAKGELRLSLEADGRGVNAGIRHTANSGLQVYLGAEALDAPITDGKEIRYITGVSWSNRAILRRVAETKRLAKQAAQLATEAQNTVKESQAEEEKE